MAGARPTARVRIVLGAASILLAMIIGASLRLVDPASSPVVAAEDPYTHMALVREHVRNGILEPLHEFGTLYPPGLHAFLAAAWAFTGADLYEIVRFGPVLLGTIGILGVGLLLWRNEGVVAAFVGALAYAVAPEVIFRSTMMAPTALDLAVLPFLLYALVEMVKGRLAWTGVAAPVALLLVIAHPWLFGILALAGGLFALSVIGLSWSTDRATSISPRGLAAAVAVVGGGFGVALWMGAAYILEWPIALRPVGPIIFLLSLVPIFLVRANPARAERLVSGPRRKAPRLAVRATISAALAAFIVGITLIAAQHGMPENVDLPRMVGWPILLLAAGAVVALPFIRSPVAHLGSALAIVTYPFVVFNPLNSEFWPHRTVVFMTIGLVLLTGVAARGILMAASWLGSRIATRRALPSGMGRRAFTAVLPALLVIVPVGGSVYAVTPDQYPGWYRLYHECELEALGSFGAELSEDHTAVVVTGSWQSKLVLAAFTENATRVWLDEATYVSEERQAHLEELFTKEDRSLYVLVDRHLELEAPPEADTSFLEEEPWRPHEAWCEGEGGFTEPRLKAYRLEVES